MIKLKKYHLYKVFHKVDNQEYLMIYLGKRKDPKIYQGKEVKQVWGIGSTDTPEQRRHLRNCLYKFKQFNTYSFNLEIHHNNHEYTIDVLEEIPLASIKMPLWELKGTPGHGAAGSVNPYANDFKSSFLKPKKDYSKMRVINL